ncbi:hypothetical protein RvY_06199-2 [Ramazzottius varieornatus]|uniref:Uncharacterized protein n=1 Tax=Ramazzottius varieornatus TaxID=947166 RepID=A0A1D1V368_RAMVA|nr:hypothetical protein RvY_06199-2 [Ramazzottius varieornatus]
MPVHGGHRPGTRQILGLQHISRLRWSQRDSTTGPSGGSGQQVGATSLYHLPTMHSPARLLWLLLLFPPPLTSILSTILSDFRFRKIRSVGCANKTVDRNASNFFQRLWMR